MCKQLHRGFMGTHGGKATPGFLENVLECTETVSPPLLPRGNHGLPLPHSHIGLHPTGNPMTSLSRVQERSETRNQPRLGRRQTLRSAGSQQWSTMCRRQGAGLCSPPKPIPGVPSWPSSPQVPQSLGQGRRCPTETPSLSMTPAWTPPPQGPGYCAQVHTGKPAPSLGGMVGDMP